MAHSGKTITFATDLVPQEDNVYNLGDSSQRWKINGIAPGNARVFYGTCNTPAGTVLKEVICAQYDKVLTIGDMFIVKFSITNTGAVGSLQLTIKNSTEDTAGTTAKNIKRQYNGTGANNLVSTAELNKDSISVFIYNGTYWILTNADYNNTYSYMRPYESTAKGSYSSINLNPAKTAAAGWRFQLSAGKYFMYTHYYDNQAQSALTLNIGSTGAKPIYINGAASSSSNYTLPGGQYLVYYDGTNYYFRTDDKITGNITGNAATATAASLTSTANAVAYYTNTTGTFGSKASANGALYATSANGALQWGTLPIAQGGTGVTSFTKNQVILSDNTNGTTGLTSRAYSDSTSAGALSSTSTNFVTERDVYYGLPTLNNAHNYSSSSTYYAPTAGGTAGHVLIGAGTTAAPVWYGGTVMSGSAAASWKTAFNGTTDATASNAAAVTIAGGLGIAKSLIVGTTATITNDTRSPKFTLTVSDADKAYLQYNTTDSSIDFIFV